MKLLKQKYHGLPGLGVNGKIGKNGKSGESIFIGNINDFFDGEYIDIGTYVYTAKRILDNQIASDNSEYDIDTINATIETAWKVTQKEISQYFSSQTADFYNAVKNSSNDENSYINFKTFYYTGTRLTNNDICKDLNGYDDPSTLIMDADGIELDLNGDFISMSYMLLTAADPTNTKNASVFKQYKSEYDQTITKAFTNSSNSINSIYYNIYNKVTHFEFDPSAAITTCPWIPYDTNDAIYQTSPDAGLAFEKGILLQQPDYSNYYYLNPSTSFITYIVQDVSTQDDRYYVTDIHDRIIAEYDINNESVQTRFEDTEHFLDLSTYINDTSIYWNMYYKTSQQLSAEQRSDIYSEDDLVDYKGKAFYGISNASLYIRTSSGVELNPNIKDDEISKKYFKEYLDNIETNGNSSYAKAKITGPGLEVYYSLDPNDTSLFIPNKLKSEYKAGDVLYFYVDYDDFTNSYDILYMVSLTEEMLNCTPSQLISYAVRTEPFKITLFNTNEDRASSFNNMASMCDTSIEIEKIYRHNSEKYDISISDADVISHDAYVSIADKYSDAPLILCGKNDKECNTFNAFSIFNSSSYIHTFSSIITDSSILFNTSNAIKMNNLYVNINNISDKVNVELNKSVYNNNVKFDKYHFIKPLYDINLYFDKNNKYSSVFMQTINGNDYFNDIKNLNDYFYGCDIYNKDMQKIKTFSSTDETFNIKFTPDVNVDTYYIQMFASSGQSLKYYSKMAKLSITYTEYIVNDNALPSNLRTPASDLRSISRGLLSPLKIPSISRNYIKRYAISSYKLEIIGEQQSIIKETPTGNIIFDLSDITSEYTNTSLNIYTKNSSIIIDDVLFNHIGNDQTNVWVPNDWSNISFVSSSDNIFKYNIQINSNLPHYDSSIYNSSIYNTIDEYVITGSDDEIKTSESDLFKRISENNIVTPTKQRSILVTALYHYENNSEIFYENYSIIQPGFTDTRNVPNIYLNAHLSMSDLQKYNTLENGVTANQFVTYLDIDIKDFKDQWGQFANKNTKITLDCSISNIKYDLNWQNSYLVQNLTPRRTFRTLLENDQTAQLNNYVKILSYIIETNNNELNNNLTTDTSITQNIQTGNFSTLKDASFRVQNTFVLYSNDQSIDISNNIIPCNSDFIKATMLPEKINLGVQDDITIELFDIPITNTTENIKLKLLVEFGNPMIANIYFKFVVNNLTVKINQGENKIHYFNTFIPDGIYAATNTYLSNMGSVIQLNENISKLNYKFASDSIDISFNPLSYMICPADIESSYTNIYGDIYKYGIKEQILKKLSFFNEAAYDINSSIYNYSGVDIRNNSYYPFNNMFIKKSFIQDNIKYISVKPTSLYKSFDMELDNTLQTQVDSSLKTHNILDFIEGNKYLSIVYQSSVLQPRIRNNSYTFYYNDNEYQSDKYNQTINNLPIFAYIESSIKLRDEELINSMDKWNDYYAEHLKNNGIKTYNGILSLYGNGYTQLIDENSKNASIENCQSLDEVNKLNSDIINNYYNVSEININPSKNNDPDTNEYFRGFLYNINWEYPYYNNTGISPYRIVSSFDNYLKNMVESSEEQVLPEEYQSYQNYYNALIESSLYENRMIPYTLLFDINPRISYNYESNVINVLMLRKPSIGIDTDIINNSTEFKQKYMFNRRLFNISSVNELTNPYTVMMDYQLQKTPILNNKQTIINNIKKLETKRETLI